MIENSKRFKIQYWIFDDPYLAKSLNKIQAEVGSDRMIIYDIRKIRSEIDRYVATIPKTISSKSGIPRHSCLGNMATPIPLNRIPLLPGYQQSIVLETRTPSQDDNRKSTNNNTLAKSDLSVTKAATLTNTSTHSTKGKSLLLETR